MSVVEAAVVVELVAQFVGVAQVVAAVPVAVAVQVVEVVEVVQVAAVDLRVLVTVEAVLVVAVLEEAQVGLVAVQEADPLAAKTAKFVARKRGTLLKVSKRARMPKRLLQKSTESDSA